MVVRHNVTLPPTVHHCQQTEVTVWLPFRVRDSAETEPVEDVIAEQQFAVPLFPKHRVSRSVDACGELLALSLQYQLEQFGHRCCVLPYLLLRGRVEHREPGVDVPLVAVDAQRDVDLDILDPALPPRDFPGELVVRVPGGAHAQERRVRDRLRVGRDAVVLGCAQVHKLGAEALEYRLDESEAGRGGPVIDQHEWLPGWIDVRPVEGVAGDDLDVCGKMLFECGYFGRLT